MRMILELIRAFFALTKDIGKIDAQGNHYNESEPKTADNPEGSSLTDAAGGNRGFTWPTEDRPPRVTLHFGLSDWIPPGSTKPYNHIGTDYAGSGPVFAVEDGVIHKILAPNPAHPSTHVWRGGKWVEVATRKQAWTPYVKMVGASHQFWSYKHVKPIAGLKVGQKVKRGQKIGTRGQYGYSFGGHLHLELWKYAGRKVKTKAYGETYWPNVADAHKFLKENGAS